MINMPPPKKPRKASAYSKRFGKFLKKGKSWKEAHRLAKGGKQRKKTSKAKMPKKKSKSRSPTQTASRPKMRKMKKIGVIGTGMIAFPIARAGIQGLWNYQNPRRAITWAQKGQGSQLIAAGIGVINGFFGSYFPLKIESNGNIATDFSGIAVGWLPAIMGSVLLGVLRFFNVKSPEGLPISLRK